MQCPKCKKENTADAKYCKECGADITQSSGSSHIQFVVCPNGHSYNPKDGFCAFCPPEDRIYTTAIEDSTGDNSKEKQDATLIVQKKKVMGGEPGEGDKTVILQKDAQKANPQPASRRLVGWLVTYDLNPMGTDFRIFEGRTKIGKGTQNDIILRHSTVSDEHALLLYRDKYFIIEDRLSTNGTGINGESIEDKAKLVSGDVIRFGNVYCKFITVGEITK